MNLITSNIMKKLKSKEKHEFIKFIKEQFGETIVYDQEGYPLYFDGKGLMKPYDLNDGYKLFKQNE